MQRIFAITLFAIASRPANAALNGFYDSARVLHAILGEARVADALRQQPIIFIDQIQNGYRLKSEACQVDVTVNRMIAARPGPTPFTLRIGKGKCK